MTATAMPARGKRYPARYMVRAREMHKAGWSNAEIARILGRELGDEPSAHAVGFWVSPKRREANAESNRRRRRELHPQRRLVGAELLVVRALERMRALAGAELEEEDVAKVMRLDLGVELSASQVRYALKTDGVPRPLRRWATERTGG